MDDMGRNYNYLFINSGPYGGPVYFGETVVNDLLDFCMQWPSCRGYQTAANKSEAWSFWPEGKSDGWDWILVLALDEGTPYSQCERNEKTTFSGYWVICPSLVTWLGKQVPSLDLANETKFQAAIGNPWGGWRYARKAWAGIPAIHPTELNGTGPVTRIGNEYWVCAYWTNVECFTYTRTIPPFPQPPPASPPLPPAPPPSPQSPPFPPAPPAFPLNESLTYQGACRGPQCQPDGTNCSIITEVWSDPCFQDVSECAAFCEQSAAWWADELAKAKADPLYHPPYHREDLYGWFGMPGLKTGDQFRDLPEIFCAGVDWGDAGDFFCFKNAELEFINSGEEARKEGFKLCKVYYGPWPVTTGYIGNPDREWDNYVNTTCYPSQASRDKAASWNPYA